MRNFELISKTRLARNACEYTLYAPLVSRRCRAGQFVILRVDEDGERVPFTLCDFDRERGTITILVQEVGFTTDRMARLNVGDVFKDVVGPLGNPTDLDAYDNICLVAGGIGAAVIHPQAKKLREDGKRFDVILGSRTKSLLMYADKFSSLADNFYAVTDDGTSDRKGVVTDVLQEVAASRNYDLVFAVGPLRMMQAVSDAAKRLGIKCVVSMNSLMVDGTGMCGCCRVTVGGKVKYACVDGPEFDGADVDFEEAIARNRSYEQFEHTCRLRGAK